MLKLKQIRLEKSLSIPQLVELSGVPRSTIQDIEKRGDCMVSNLSKIAKALNVSLDDLWDPNNLKNNSHFISNIKNPLNSEVFLSCYNLCSFY